MNTADLSAAQRALAEHTEVLLRLDEWKTKCADLEAQSRADQNLIDLQRTQLAAYSATIDASRAETKRWIIYSTKLMTGLEAVQQIINLNRQIAIEAAQQLVVEEMNKDLTPEDLEALKRLAGTSTDPQQEQLKEQSK